MSLISEDRDRVGGRRSEIGDDFIVRQKSDKDDKGRVPSRGARKGLKTMLREDYVEDKSRFELKEVYRSCTTYIARHLYEKRTKDFPSPEGIVNI